MPAQKYFNAGIKFLEMVKRSPNFMTVARTCRLVSASEGKCAVEFEVEESLTNPMGSLHGGCSATLVDIWTTAACILTPRGVPGVSVDLHMTYLSAAMKGETVMLEAEIMKQGKTLAFTRADLIRKHDKVIIATGLHTKAFPSKAIPKEH